MFKAYLSTSEEHYYRGLAGVATYLHSCLVNNQVGADYRKVPDMERSGRRVVVVAG